MSGNKVTSVNLAYVPEVPQSTGVYEIDKQTFTKYKSELTSQKNKVIDAVVHGVVSVDQMKWIAHF